ncbi:MAG: hypothetical protein ACI909_001027 [Planctomycetota bacterium]|jgi:hypothetical protein
MVNTPAAYRSMKTQQALPTGSVLVDRKIDFSDYEFPNAAALLAGQANWYANHYQPSA